MNRFLLLLISVFFVFSTISAKQIKILAIGNSFSDDAIEHYLHGLVEAAGDEIIIGNMYIGGSGLDLHYNNSVNNSASYSYRKIVNGVKTTTEAQTLSKAITDEAWDYISLQQVSQNSGLYATYFPYLTNLTTYVKGLATNPQMKFVLHSTWAYQQNSTHAGFANYGNNQTTMFNAIIDASFRAATTAEIDIVIPAGTAIQNGRTSTIGDNFCRDGYHLELTYGRYTASCAWFEKLFEKSVIGNTYIPASMSPFQAAVAQHAAHNAVEKPQEITSLANLKEDDVETVPFTTKINISFASTSQTGNWNLIGDFNQNTEKKNLRDIDGNFTDVSLWITKRFTHINSNGPTNTTTEMNMPTEVTKESYYGNTQLWMNLIVPKSEFKYTSLDVTAKYDLAFFGSRMSAGDNRETYYKVSGNTGSDTIMYLNASNNTNNIVKATNISPNGNGEIYVEVGPGPNNNNSYGFYYITATTLSVASTSGTNNIADKKSTHIYPNPFNNQFNVYVDQSASLIKIIGIDGRVVYTLDNPQKNQWHTISTAHINPGIYIIQSGENKTIAIKK